MMPTNSINEPERQVAERMEAQRNIAAEAGEENELRKCWICLATHDDNRYAAWVQPCKCRGSTKWVHPDCLYRWIDEKQMGNVLRAVICPQCLTEYIIVLPQMGILADGLEACDNLVKRSSPFVAAGVFVSSLYWTSVTYGAVTFLQIVGYKEGLTIMKNGAPLALVIGLPIIPIALFLGRMTRWEDALMRTIYNLRKFARKLPLMNYVAASGQQEIAENAFTENLETRPMLADPVSASRFFCGALLLPTISTVFGCLLFESIESKLKRSFLGGFTFIVVKGIAKIYLKHQQYIRRKKRHVVDYTREC